MKKLFTYVMLLSLGATTLTSCSSSKKNSGSVLGGTNIGGTVAKTVATAVGLILLSKLLNSVMKTVTGSSTFSSLAQNTQFKSNFNENTKLNSFAGSDVTKVGLQLLVSQYYKIPLQTVTKNYNSFSTAGDLATFIGQNADAAVLNKIK